MRSTITSLSGWRSLAVPLMASFLLDRVPPRPLKRLLRRRDDLLDDLRQAQLAASLRRNARGTPSG